jgi:hypothetical protein
MCDFVSEGFAGLGIADIRSDPYRSHFVVGQPVGTRAVAALKRVAVVFHLVRKRIPQPGDAISIEQRGADVGELDTVSLADIVEHCASGESTNTDARDLGAIVIGRGVPVLAGRKDP